MTDTKQKQNNEAIINKAFEDLYIRIIEGSNYNKNKTSYQSELVGYALTIYKEYGNITPLKKLVVNTGLYMVYKPYFDYIGLFMVYNVKDSFLRVVKDSDGLFINGVYDSFEVWKNNLPKEPKTIDYKKRLTSLFKGKPRQDIEKIINEFLKN